LSVALLR